MSPPLFFILPSTLEVGRSNLPVLDVIDERGHSKFKGFLYREPRNRSDLFQYFRLFIV